MPCEVNVAAHVVVELDVVDVPPLVFDPDNLVQIPPLLSG